MDRTRLANYALLIFLGTVWGSSFLFIELSLTGFGPVTIAAIRIVGGATILGTALAFSGYQLPHDPKTWGMLFVMGMTGSVLPFFLINSGQVLITSSLAAIFISTVPIFTLVLAHFFTDDRITPAKAIGVTLGIVGVVLLVGPEALKGVTDNLLGQLMVMGGALGFAVTTVIARRLRRLPSLVTGSSVLFCAAIVTVPLAFLHEQPFAGDIGWRAILGVAGLSLFSTGLAFLALYRLLATAGPNFMSANNYLGTCVGVMWGVVLLGEPLTWWMILALAIILAGVALATYGASAAGRAVSGERKGASPAESKAGVSRD